MLATDNLRLNNSSASSAKKAHKKNSVVWPSILERQSVPLALAVWDQSTYNAVLLQNEKKNISNQTYQFLVLITRFWKMCNIHSPGKDIRLRDPDSKVFELHDKRFHFFQGLFLGFRIGKCLVVLVELENLVHTPLPA